MEELIRKGYVEQVNYFFFYFSWCYYFYFCTGFFCLFYKRILDLFSNEFRERIFLTVKPTA